MSFAFFLHDRCAELRQNECGCDVNVHYLCELLNAEVCDRLHADHTGIVEENINSTICFYCCIKDLLWRIQIACISDNINSFAALSLDFVNYRLSALFVTSCNNDFYAFLLSFNNNTLSPNQNDYKYYGQSVRLVCNVKQ